MIELKKVSNKNNIMEIILGYHPIPYNDKNNEERIGIMQGSKLLINYMVEYNSKFKKSENPWEIINQNMPNLFDELAIAKQNAEPSHSGSGIKSVKCLPSNPKILKNKLKILLAEKMQKIIMYLMRLVL